METHDIRTAETTLICDQCHQDIPPGELYRIEIDETGAIDTDPYNAPEHYPQPCMIPGVRYPSVGGGSQMVLTRSQERRFRLRRRVRRVRRQIRSLLPH